MNLNENLLYREYNCIKTGYINGVYFEKGTLHKLGAIYISEKDFMVSIKSGSSMVTVSIEKFQKNFKIKS